MSGAYNDPQFTVIREVVVPAPAAGAAGVTKFALYAGAVLLNAQTVVKTAGTSANTGSYLQILNGTATAGTLLTGSATAGTLVTAALSGTVAASGVISVLQGTDATGVGGPVVIQYSAPVA